MNPLYRSMPTTIFEEMSALATAHGAINLGQGFPDGPGPRDLLEAAAAALRERSSQYPPSAGLPETRAAAAAHYRRHQGLAIGADDVLITSGATEAIAAALLAIVSPGDEVILLAPMYDAYLPLVRRAGGIPRVMTVDPPGWRLPIAGIAAAIGPATRAIVLNNPMNPTARSFDADEMAALAALCVTHDLIAVADEVWEHVTFDGRRHRPLIAEEGMAARTVKIGSAGKMFALTGWKVGFVVAAPDLLAPIARAHQFLGFSTPPNLQIAVAAGLAKPADWFAGQAAGYGRGRDRLAAALAAGGIATLPAEASYFLCVDLAASGIAGDDRTLARRLVAEAGVAAIPLSPFYEGAGAPAGMLRLCFAKADAVLDEAAARLTGWVARERG